MYWIANTSQAIPALVFIFGCLVVICLLAKAALDRLSLPPILGYLVIGTLLSVLGSQLPLRGESGETVLTFLSAIGVVVLLFRVGIESDLHALMEEFSKAAAVWLPNMLISGLPGYFVTRHLLSYEFVPSLFVGVAMTATSIGVSVAVWQETEQLKTKEGRLLLDTAELDDISGVGLMALLFAIAPVLGGRGGAGSGEARLLPSLGVEAGLFALKFGIFVAAILALGRYLEAPLAHSARHVGNKATVLIFVVGLGFSIAGLAGWMGLSLPIGALFAGLLLSRHRKDYGFQPFYKGLYLLFVPFFFVHIGYQVDPAVALGALGAGTALALVAILGKIAGTGAVTWLFTGAYGVLLIGASMVPRAEITMVVIQRGKALGEWAMPDELYAAMVFVSAATCLGTALFLHWALRHWK
jgi:Kef-type K+ transport system membrane component KefB